MRIKDVPSLLLPFALALAFVGAARSVVAAPYTLQGRTVRVLDGDTIEILDAQNTTHKVRLSEIDSPEKNQPHGQDAKAALSKMVFGKDVVVNVSTKDRYGRAIGNVLVDGIDVNGSLVKYGYSWCYRAYKHRAIIEQYEAEAREHKRGLWKSEKPIPPWDFRKGIR